MDWEEPIPFSASQSLGLYILSCLVAGVQSFLRWDFLIISSWIRSLSANEYSWETGRESKLSMTSAAVGLNKENKVSASISGHDENVFWVFLRNSHGNKYMAGYILIQACSSCNFSIFLTYVLWIPLYCKTESQHYRIAEVVKDLLILDRHNMCHWGTSRPVGTENLLALLYIMAGWNSRAGSTCANPSTRSAMGHSV